MPGHLTVNPIGQILSDVSTTAQEVVVIQVGTEEDKSFEVRQMRDDGGYEVIGTFKNLTFVDLFIDAIDKVCREADGLAA